MKRIIILSLVVVAIVVGISYQLFSNQEKIAKSVAEEKNAIPFTIEAIAIVEKEFTESTLYTGQILPYKTTNISAQSYGKVVKLNFKKGGLVSKNQVLIELDATILRANVAIQKANIAKFKKDVDRLQALFAEKNASTIEVENAQIQLITAQQQLKIAEKELSNSVTVSPSKALVAEKHTNEGEILQPGSAIATLVDVSSVLAKIYLNENDALQLKIGNKLEGKTKIYPNKKFIGTVENIIPIATEAKLYPAEIKIENTNPKQLLLAGMQIEIEIRLAKGKRVITIPRMAITGGFSEPSIFKIKGGKIVKKSITLGALHGELIEVQEGIGVGDTVASLGLSNLENNMRTPTFTLVKY